MLTSTLGQTIAETILAIMLLDSHNVQDALQVFLDQRLAAMTSLFSTPRRTGTSSTATSRRPSFDGKSGADERRSRNQRLDAVQLLRALSPAPPREAPKEQVDTSRMDEQLASKRVSSTLLATIRGLAETLAATRAVFGVELHALIEEIQNGKSSISTESVLKSLPSAQILTSYLPSSVRNFTPYVTTVRPDLEPIIGSWTEKALQRFQDSLGSWLRDIKTVRGTWSIRRQTKQVLRDLGGGGTLSKAEQKQLFTIIEQGCGRHVHRLWERRLRDLADEFENSVRQGSAEIDRGETPDAIAERDPLSIRPVPPTYPQVPAVKLGGSTRAQSSTQMTEFHQYLRRHVSARTPLVDHVITMVEQAAADLAFDLRPVRASELSEGFDTAAKATFGKVVSRLRANFDVSKPESKLFIGRIALHLVASSDLPSSLRAEGEPRASYSIELLSLD